MGWTVSVGVATIHNPPPPKFTTHAKMPKSVERFQIEHKSKDLKEKSLWIDSDREDKMKRQMDVIEKKKGVNAILLCIFEEVGAWITFPNPPGVDYLALLLSTHLK